MGGTTRVYTHQSVVLVAVLNAITAVTDVAVTYR
jgi:hypothetical protein